MNGSRKVAAFAECLVSGRSARDLTATISMSGQQRLDNREAAQNARADGKADRDAATAAIGGGRRVRILLERVHMPISASIITTANGASLQLMNMCP